MLGKWSPLELAKLAILGSLLVALRSLRGFLVIAALIIAVRKTSIWPSAILGFVAVGIPIILLGVRSWNRWFHPDRQPARWLKHGEERLQSLETVLVLYGIAAFLVMVVMGFLVHDNASLAVLLPKLDMLRISRMEQHSRPLCRGPQIHSAPKRHARSIKDVAG